MPYAFSAGTLSGKAFITVPTTDDPAINAANLLASYALAKGLMPHGTTPSATNRVTLFVPPGNYDLGTGSLTLDAEFVDSLPNKNC